MIRRIRQAVDRRRLMRRTVVVGTAGSIPYRPTYRESSYARPLLKRLTPLAQFVLALMILGALSAVSVLFNAVSQWTNGTALLSDRLFPGSRAAYVAQDLSKISITYYGTPPATVASSASSANSTNNPAAAVAKKPAKKALAPTVVPTIDPNRAPWADYLTPQADGSLMAPRPVINKAIADLTEYYTRQRDLSLDSFLAQRAELVTNYYIGPVMDQMRQIDLARTTYEMNRSGRVTVEIRSFAPDGLHARAGVISRDWVSDVYDISTKQLIASGRVSKDTLTIMAIYFDQNSGRWKFAGVEETVELQP